MYVYIYIYIYRSYTDTCKYHHACTCGRLDSTWYPPRAASEVLQLAALRVQISVHSLCTSKWIKNYSCFSLRGTLHVPSSRWQAGEDWGLKRRCWSLKDFPIFSILHHSSLFHHTSSDVHHILSIPIYPKVSWSTFLSVEGWPTEATGSSSHGQNAGRADVQPGAEDLKNGYLFLKYVLIWQIVWDCQNCQCTIIIINIYQHYGWILLKSECGHSTAGCFLAGWPPGLPLQDGARKSHRTDGTESEDFTGRTARDAAMMLLCRFMICHVAAQKKYLAIL